MVVEGAENRSDEALLATGKSDPGAFGVFYRRRVDAVLAFFLRRTRDRELAADLTAETFAAALAALPGYEPRPDGALAWLFTIAHRKLVDSIRRGKVEDRARRRLRLEPLVFSDEDIEQVERRATAAAGDSALAALEELSTTQRVASVLARSRFRVALVALVLVFATTAIALAATGVILTGSPVRTVSRPLASAGDGIPVQGGSRLLSLRVADPAGGLPWGMRITHTTRGLICVQVGRIYHGRLGQLGVDGAFANDGRFHPLPADALPDVLGGFQGLLSGNCAAPEETYSGDIVGLYLSAANNPPRGGVMQDRREISFGLLGSHALSITYRSGSETRSQPVLRGLGAYLIVQRYTSGRHLGGISETDGRDEPANYSAPAAPNGALTSITYNYAGKRCVDTGNGIRLASCGLSEVPPPMPAPLPIVHVSLRVHRNIHNTYVSFRAPYPVTSARQDYTASARACQQFGGAGPDANVARGQIVRIPVALLLARRPPASRSCARPVRIDIEYIRFMRGLPQPTPIGSVVLR